jgi:membrane protease YdiL (CAAX protease family)
MSTVSRAAGSCLAVVQRWLPPARQRLVPWSGVEILTAVFLMSFWQAVGVAVLDAVYFFSWYYGEDILQAAQSTADPAVRELALVRIGLWLPILILPFQVASLLLLFNRVSGTWPYQMGITCRRGRQNLGLGVLGALIVTPAVLGVNVLVNKIFQEYTHVVVQEHPYMREAGHMQLPEYIALFYAVVIAAPLLEELLIHGVLQQWFATRSWGGHLAMAAALVVALAKRKDDIVAGWRGDGQLVHALLPALFVLAMVPGFLAVWKWSRGPVWPAIYGTGLLFAVLHAPVWPSPIALFPFGLFQGWLFQRTQSLVGPVVVHALFNGVSYLVIVWR